MALKYINSIIFELSLNVCFTTPMIKFFKYLVSPVFFKQLLIAGVSIFALFLLIFVGLRFYTKHGEGSAVPDLKGLQIDNAINALENEGFEYQIDSVFILDKKPGTIVEQDPDPGTLVKSNRIIYLTMVSYRTPEINFPDIENKTFLEAKAILENFGLKLGDTTYQSDIARDAVLDYTFKGNPIKQGDLIPKGSRINLILGDGLGANTVEIPNLVGLTLDEANFSIKGSSLSLGIVTYEGNVTDSANAKVIAQSPNLTDSVNTVNIGSKINLILSNE